jgi:hypothetical protein
VHTLRLQLKAQGVNDSWSTLREKMATQRPRVRHFASVFRLFRQHALYESIT